MAHKKALQPVEKFPVQGAMEMYYCAWSGFLKQDSQRIAPVFAVMRAVGLETQFVGCLYIAGPIVNEERF